MATVIEREKVDVEDVVTPPSGTDTEHTPDSTGSDYGRCPICGKPLR